MVTSIEGIQRKDGSRGVLEATQIHHWRLIMLELFQRLPNSYRMGSIKAVYGVSKCGYAVSGNLQKKTEGVMPSQNIDYISES